MNRNAKAIVRLVLRGHHRRREVSVGGLQASIVNILLKGGVVQLPSGNDATFFNSLPCGHPDQKDQAKLDFWKGSGMVVRNGCRPDSCCHKQMEVTDCAKARAFVSSLTGIPMPGANAALRRQLKWANEVHELHQVRCTVKDCG